MTKTLFSLMFFLSFSSALFANGHSHIVVQTQYEDIIINWYDTQLSETEVEALFYAQGSAYAITNGQLCYNGNPVNVF